MTAPSNVVRRLKVGTLNIEIHRDGKAAGEAAAQNAAQELGRLAALREDIGVIFATGASQLDTLRALTSMPNLPWSKVHGFHLDEYVGIPADHPASFRRYLRQNLTEKVRMKEFSEIDGTVSDLEQLCQSYAAKVRSSDPQLCLLGIGENGHLAFNDPGEADFNDPSDMKVVQLDTVCRQQQAAEGWFKSLEDVPKLAVTLTIPTLFRVPRLILSAPGSRKTAIIRRMLDEPISIECPASILRTHPNVTAYLDQEAAAGLVNIAVKTEIGD
jgi:glucosamine-6-phosphate deaminase